MLAPAAALLHPPGTSSGQVSIFIVGRTEEGALASVLTGAIET